MSEWRAGRPADCCGLLRSTSSVRSSPPIPPNDVAASFYERYVERDRAIDHELTAVLLDKREQFSIREVSALNTLLPEHWKETLVAVSNDMAEIRERDAFDLLMKHVKYDIDVHVCTIFSSSECQLTRK